MQCPQEAVQMPRCMPSSVRGDVTEFLLMIAKGWNVDWEAFASQEKRYKAALFSNTCCANVPRNLILKELESTNTGEVNLHFKLEPFHILAASWSTVHATIPAINFWRHSAYLHILWHLKDYSLVDKRDHSAECRCRMIPPR